MGKSRYRNYWYGCSQTMIRRYPDLENEKGIQPAIWRNAIKNALETTAQTTDGEHKLKVIEMINFRKTHTIDGAALEVGVSRRTAQRWNSEFVNTVGRYAGFN